eukprot:CAMPEP_0116034808 /NCGR_PEP_ID=MMETSP0321-20121206/19896_1 /TAXON_ID=163516 /ORGANISM="Leptocylindrus danicus var. danicus, Strain B650" /LENGTH=233 /DNA_ID=CAMNT_0003511327 /DNA_START=70 /DNA_END=768 /DNA_ORIENTATION=+
MGDDDDDDSRILTYSYEERVEATRLAIKLEKQMIAANKALREHTQHKMMYNLLAPQAVHELTVLLDLCSSRTKIGRKAAIYLFSDDFTNVRVVPRYGDGDISKVNCFPIEAVFEALMNLLEYRLRTGGLLFIDAMKKVLPLYENLLISRYEHLVYNYAREVEKYDDLLERYHRKMASYLYLLFELFCTIGDKVRAREWVRTFWRVDWLQGAIQDYRYLFDLTRDTGIDGNDMW